MNTRGKTRSATVTAAAKSGEVAKNDVGEKKTQRKRKVDEKQPQNDDSPSSNKMKRALKDNLTVLNGKSGKEQIDGNKRRSNRLSSKKLVYKNVSLPKNPTEKENVIEVYDFEFDSNEEPKVKGKRVKKRAKPARINNFFNYGKRPPRKVKTSRPAVPPVKKVVRNIGNLPIVQIAPDSPEAIENDVAEFGAPPYESPPRANTPAQESHSPSPIPNFDYDDPKIVSDTSYSVFQPNICSSVAKRALTNPEASPWRVENELIVRPNRVYLNPPSSDESAATPQKESILSFYRDVIATKSKKTTAHSSEINASDDSPAQTSKTSAKSKMSDDSAAQMRAHASTSRSALSELSANDIPIAQTSNVAETSAEQQPLPQVSSTPKNKIIDYFGFEEDMENQENISPNKNFVNTRRRRRPLKKVKRPLKERNNQIAVGILEKPPSPVPVPEPEPAVAINEDTDNSPVEEPTNTVEINTEIDAIANKVALFDDPVVPEVETSFYTAPEKVYETRKGPKRLKSKKKVVIADSDHSDDSDAEDRVIKAMYRHKKKKNTANKKDKQEYDMWAASFNSMLEDVEDYELRIE